MSVKKPMVGGAYQSANNTSDKEVNPAHYKGDLVMRIIEHFELDFLDGQVIKCILRAGYKPGEMSNTAYSKALWYLERKVRNVNHPDEAGDLMVGNLE